MRKAGECERRTWTSEAPQAVTFGQTIHRPETRETPTCRRLWPLLKSPAVSSHSLVCFAPSFSTLQDALRYSTWDSSHHQGHKQYSSPDSVMAERASVFPCDGSLSIPQLPSFSLLSVGLCHVRYACAFIKVTNMNVFCIYDILPDLIKLGRCNSVLRKLPPK